MSTFFTPIKLVNTFSLANVDYDNNALTYPTKTGEIKDITADNFGTKCLLLPYKGAAIPKKSPYFTTYKQSVITT